MHFYKFSKYICYNFKISKFGNVFVSMLNCVCLNFKTHLSKFWCSDILKVIERGDFLGRSAAASEGNTRLFWKLVTHSFWALDAVQGHSTVQPGQVCWITTYGEKVGEGRGGSCIYLPECLAFVLTHNSSLMHPLFAMLAFLHCCCLAKDFASHIINIFVSVARLQRHNDQFCISATIHWKHVK